VHDYAVGIKRHHFARGVAVDADNHVYWLVVHDGQGKRNTYLAKYTP